MGKTNARLQLLLRVAYCRHPNVWPQILPHEPAVHSVLTTELFADGLASYDDMKSAQRVAFGYYWTVRNGRHAAHAIAAALHCAADNNMYNTELNARDAFKAVSNLRKRSAKKCFNLWAEKVRNSIFITPTLYLTPDLRTSTVLALANGIYNDHATDRLPILADALQDAGCHNDDILTYLRTTKFWCRGETIIDYLTGRR